ncbi:MAG: hypothetical protein Ta2A_22900 [Treponemataceae bacterium]|nr:MAG: hypothetical protein Ta2A_22900 [Treponemataceae bacterium]
MFENNKKRKEIILFSIIGFVYIVIAYIPISFRSPLFFGIVGSIITVFSLVLFWIMAKSKQESTTSNIFEYIGLFFIIMAIYNLCGFTGVKCFALYPEKMIEYRLQDLAYSFANHIIAEFALGLIFLVYSKIKR